MRNIRRMTIAMAAMVALLAVAGCATKAELNDVRTDAGKAQQMAAEAKQQADSAMALAERAAADAAAAAGAASQSAAAARAASEKADRILQQSLRK